MSRSRFALRAVFALLAVFFFVAATSLPGADAIKGVRDFQPDDETVEMFAAVREGRLEVRVIPRDSRQVRVLITNRSDKPLNVKVPDVLAAVPALAQFAAGGMGFPGGQQPQGLGLGNPFGNGRGAQNGGPFMNQGGGNNRGNPFFNIPPEGVAQLRLKAVCLEHGKPTPRPAMKYTLKPIDAATDNARVQAVCRMLGRGEIGQSTAQAAAWHLNNGKSWRELAAMTDRSLAIVARRPLFTPDQLSKARRVVDDLEERSKESAPGESLSAR